MANIFYKRQNLLWETMVTIVNKVLKTEAFVLTINNIICVNLLRKTAFELINYQLLYFTIYLFIIYYKNFYEWYYLVYLVNYIKILRTAAF